MPARAGKPRKSSSRRRAVKVDVDQEEDKLKISREDAKENRDVLGLTIPLGVDLEPMPSHPASVRLKKDDSTDDSRGIKREDRKPTNIKPEDTKQEPTKREVNPRLSPTQLWENEPDGQRFVPRLSPAKKDVFDAPDLNLEQENLPPENQELPPPPSLQPSPPPQPSPQPSPQPQQQAQRYHRDGRALPEVEVLLPRLEDVRRRQAARKAQEKQAPQNPGASNARQAPREDSVIIIKPEPDDDVKPLPALEEHDPAEAKEVLRTAVQNLRNPAAKVKKELLLDDELLLDALTWEGINYRYPVPLPKDVAEFQFKRDYINHLYGGNKRRTFPKPRDEMLEWHALNDWAFLTLDFTPHAPTRPGHSGLLFSCKRAEEGWSRGKGVRRTFVRVTSGNWVYMGQYKMESGVTLSTDLWKRQKPSVRRAWAEGILRDGWGGTNCIRIWFRKQRGADYELTKEDWEEGEAQIKNIRSQLVEEDIIGAFDRGEEEMGTYRMTCVGYDAEFIEVLVRNVPAWVIFDREMTAKRKELKAKSKGKAKGKGPKRTQKGKGTGSKRKPIEIESDSGSGEDDDDAKMEIKVGIDDSYQEMSTSLAGSSTGRPRRAAAMVKRQRTS